MWNRPEGPYLIGGMAVLVVAVFVASQVLAWRSSRKLIGAGRGLALVTLVVVVSEALAYLVLRLDQAGRIPRWLGHVFGALAFHWLVLGMMCLSILFLVELVLVIEMPILKKTPTPVHGLHLGALGACVVWLAALGAMQ